MTVYDCFPFFNENDLLELRINQHWNFVDKFIITEAGQTHTGHKKDFNFDHKRFEKYQSKIVYRKINNFIEEINTYPHLLDSYSVHDRSQNGQYTDDWVRDHFQGNYPVQVLTEQGATSNDIVYISSLDEIITEDAFNLAMIKFEDDQVYPLISGVTNKVVNHTRPAFGFVLDLYVYKFNFYSSKIPVAMITEFNVLQKMLPSTMRAWALHTHDSIENAGWHFSWLDNTGGEKVLLKQKSWAHSRDILPNQQVKYTHTSITEALDRLFKDYEIVKVNISKETHPEYLINNLDIYDKYIDKE